MKRMIIMLATGVLISGCRSHKEISSDQESYNCSDSVSVQTEVLSVNNLKEGINALVLSEEKGERVEFLDEGGEIEFYPDGKVALKGVAAYEIRNAASFRNSNVEIEASDSVVVNSTAETFREHSATLSYSSEKKPSSSVKSRIILFLIALLAAGAAIALLLRKSPPAP